MKATGRVAFETPAGVWATFALRYNDGFGLMDCPGSIKIAVKRPCAACLRCFVLLTGNDRRCAECGGKLTDIFEEPNSNK
jgi:hypothetical protein